MDYNPVVHFEMPYKDSKVISKFYSDAFGWKMQETGEEMGNYITAETTETTADRMIKTPGTINGGFYPLSSAPTSTAPSVVISVKDITAAMQKVKDAGGSVMGEPMDIPGVGKYVSFKDPEGNRASLLQAKDI